MALLILLFNFLQQLCPDLTGGLILKCLHVPIKQQISIGPLL